MSLSIPAMTKASNSSQSLQLGHLVVNVSGPGIANTILFTWDAREGQSSTASAVPSEFALEVPTGKSRLVQVLAVYQDSTSNLTSFFYGDQTADLAKVEESVKVSVTDLTGGLPLISGAISGRYLDTADNGPTGEVLVKYQPPGDRPSLILEKGGIAKGWFNLFALKGIPLRYIVAETGRDLFGQAVDLGDRTIFAPSPKVAKIFVPVSSRLENGVPYHEKEAETHVVGYFGPGAGASRVVCREIANNDPTNGRLVYGTSTPMTFGVISSNTAAEPTNLSNVTTPATQILIQGGTASGDSTCVGYLGNVATNLYSNFLPLRAYNFNGGREGIGGFFYPFGFANKPAGPWAPASFAFDLANSSRPLQVDTNSTLKFGGRLLPGMGELLNGLRVYHIPAAGASQLEDMEFAPCGEIRAGDRFGSVQIGTGTVNAAGGFYAATSLNAASLAPSEGIAICFDSALGPIKRGVYLDSGRLSGGPTGPYLRVEGLQAYRMNNVNLKSLPNGGCFNVKLKTYGPNHGGPAPVHNLLADLQVVFTSPKFSFFSSDSGCAAGVSTPSVTMLAGSNETEVWLKPTATGPDTGEISLGLSTSEVQYHSDGAYSLGNPILKPQFGPSAVASACVRGRLHAYEPDGVTPFRSPVSVTPVPSSPRGATAFQSGSCTGGDLSSTTISPGSPVSDDFYFIFPPSGSEKISIGALAGWSLQQETVSVGTGPAIAVKVRVVTSTADLSYNECRTGHLEVVNNEGTPVPAPVALPFVLDMGGNASFHADPGCHDPFGAGVIAPGVTRIPFYYRALTNASDHSVIVSVPGIESVSSGMIEVVQPPAGDPYFVIDANFAYRGKKVLGSHEFDGAGEMNVLMAAVGSMISCTRDPDNSDCMSRWDSTNKIFKIKKEDLTGNHGFEVEMENAGKWQRTRFSMSDLFGGDVTVLECTVPVILSSGDHTAISMNEVNCLGTGVTLTVGAGASISLSGSTAIVGRALSLNEIVATDSDLIVPQTISFSSLANLILKPVSDKAAVKYASGSNLGILSSRVVMPASAGSLTRGVSTASPASMLTIEGLEIETETGADGIGIEITNRQSATTNMKSVKVSATNANGNFVGIRLATDGSDFGTATLEKFDYQGEGTGLLAESSAGFPVGLSTARDWRIKTAEGYGLKLMGEFGGVIDGLWIEQDSSAKPPIALYGNTNGASSLIIKNARLSNRSSAPMVDVNNSASANHSIDLSNTHWISRANQSNLFNLSTGSGSLSMTGTTAGGSNYICKDGAWTHAAIGNASFGGTLVNMDQLADIRTVASGANSCY